MMPVSEAACLRSAALARLPNNDKRVRLSSQKVAMHSGMYRTKIVQVGVD
jgi:hypothetical protein